MVEHVLGLYHKSPRVMIPKFGLLHGSPRMVKLEVELHHGYLDSEQEVSRSGETTNGASVLES